MGAVSPRSRACGVRSSAARRPRQANPGGVRSGAFTGYEACRRDRHDAKRFAVTAAGLKALRDAAPRTWVRPELISAANARDVLRRLEHPNDDRSAAERSRHATAAAAKAQQTLWGHASQRRKRDLARRRMEWPRHAVSIRTLYTGEREVHQRRAAAKVRLSRLAGRR